MTVDVSPKPERPEPSYLGDGVYATFDGYQIWLSTVPGGGNSRIAIEPAVYHALREYGRRLRFE